MYSAVKQLTTLMVNWMFAEIGSGILRNDYLMELFSSTALIFGIDSVIMVYLSASKTDISSLS